MIHKAHVAVVYMYQWYSLRLQSYNKTDLRPTYTGSGVSLNAVALNVNCYKLLYGPHYSCL